MESLKILLIMFLFSTAPVRAQWQVQLDVQNFTHLDRIFFLNDNLGWVIGGSTIGSGSPYFYTTDGGLNWFLSENWWDVQGTDLVFVNPDTGFIASHDGIILKTTDGGQNWTEIQTPATQDVLRLFFVDENNGWATLYNSGSILHTVNCGGAFDLQQVYSYNSSIVSSLYFTNINTGWGAGGYDDGSNIYYEIFITYDQGNNWNPQYSITNAFYIIYDIFFFNSMNGWAVGQKSSLNTYLILHTIDGGEIWEEQMLEGYSGVTMINCVYFVNDTTGWIGIGEAETSNPYGAIFFTNDGGVNWQLQQEFESAMLDIQMINQDTGWAVGGDFVYHITNATVNIKEKPMINFAIKIIPNPTNGIISLDFPKQLPINEYEVKITSITGKLCFHRAKEIDNHLDLSFLQNGVYFLTIQYKSSNQIYSLTKKIVKL